METEKITCELCGTELPEEKDAFELYGLVICGVCAYTYCVQCELCGELALDSDIDLLKVPDGEEELYYHRKCFEKKQLLDKLKARIKKMVDTPG